MPQPHIPNRDEQFAHMATDLGAQVRANEQHQQLMATAIEHALHRPTNVNEIHISGVGVAEIGPKQRAIVVALPSGEQLRIHLDPQTARSLAGPLGAPFEGESEDALQLPGS